jgi:hypothetical protein
MAKTCSGEMLISHSFFGVGGKPGNVCGPLIMLYNALKPTGVGMFVSW